MKNKWKEWLAISGAALLISLTGTFVIYQFCPKLLCVVVHDVQATGQEAPCARDVAEESITVPIVPTGRYLKNIAISVSRKGEPSRLLAVLEKDGRTVARENIALSEKMKKEYCRLDIEAWVKPGEEYQLTLSFPAEEATEGTTMTYSQDAGPYLQCVYGSYSKKLLALWAFVFFIGGFYLTNSIISKGNIKSSEIDSVKKTKEK